MLSVIGVRALQSTLSRRALFERTVLGMAALTTGALAEARRGYGNPRAVWTLVTPSTRPPVRRDHCLIGDRDRGTLYLFGGRTGGKSLADLWKFDPSLATWSEVVEAGPKPAARFGHNATYDATHQRLVVAMSQGDGSAFFNDVWAFDPESGMWSQLGAGSDQQPRERYGAAVAADDPGGRFFISHGFTDAGRFDDTWAFDLTADAWQKIPTSGVVPLKRCLVRATWDAANQRLLLFGGQSDPHPFLGDFWSLDVRGGRWTERTAPLLPGARNLYGATSDASGRRWLVFGGNTPNGPRAELWVYDADQDTWSSIGTSPGVDTPSARESLDITVVGTSGYVFGGNDGSSDLDDTWMLEVAQ